MISFRTIIVPFNISRPIKNHMKHQNSTFSERLNACLDKEGFPPKNRGRIQLLAEMVGLTHRGAGKWINGQSTPPAKKYESLAKKLNVNEKWLRTGEGPMTNLDISSTSLKEESFQIAIKIYAADSFLTEKKTIYREIYCTLSHAGEFFGIILDTEAMSPRFPSGSIIIFENTIPKDGDFVLVNYNGLPNPIFRQLLIIGGVWYLNAHNPKFDRLILQDKTRILGKLVQAILSFD